MAVLRIKFEDVEIHLTIGQICKNCARSSKQYLYVISSS
jgi:hypothetical protein